MAKEIKTIGVLTSGGDAPGMNAAIRRKKSLCCRKECKGYPERLSGSSGGGYY